MKQIVITFLIVTVVLNCYGQGRQKNKANSREMPYIEAERADERTTYLIDKYISTNDTAKITQFISAGISPNAMADHTNNITILNKALRWYKIETVECLLRNGADPNLRGRQIHRSMFSDAQESVFSQYPLEAAADANSIEKMELLLKYGADINRCTKQLNEIAAKKGNIEMMMYLTKKTGINAIPKNALAVMTEHSFEHDASKVTVETVDQLVKEGVDVNAYGPTGKTALINVFTVREIQNRVGLTEALLKHGADPNLKDRMSDHYKGTMQYYPTPPLVHAAKLGDLTIVKMLVENGAKDLNAALVSARKDEIKEYLILKGAK